MDSELLFIFNSFADFMRNEEGVLSAWNFGSALHGLTDEYSDADVVFLIDGRYFKKTEQRLDGLLSSLCDEVILRWEEDFNSGTIINNGYLLKKNGRIFQFDIFLLNNDCLDDFMCRIHYTGLSGKDIIFDNDGSAAALVKRSPGGTLWRSGTDRLIRTYLYHFNMTAKYLLRRDYFKLNHVMSVLYDTHASLLLTEYDRIKWGGAGNKLRFIPEDKKPHLMKYYCTDDFRSDRDRLWQCFEWFEGDIPGPEGYADKFSAVGEYWKSLTADI